MKIGLYDLSGAETLTAYRRLAAAILELAVRDARSGNRYNVEARLWLARDPLAGDFLDFLDIPRQQVTRWVDGLEQVRQPALPGLTEP